MFILASSAKVYNMKEQDHLGNLLLPKIICDSIKMPLSHLRLE
jgi:hypothetical protein